MSNDVPDDFGGTPDWKRQGPFGQESVRQTRQYTRPRRKFNWQTDVSRLFIQDKEIVSKVIEEIEACIIQLDPQNWPILMQNTKRFETKQEDDTNKIYGLE